MGRKGDEMKVIETTWSKVLYTKCYICNSQPKKGASEGNKITKKFLGIPYNTTVICQGCISRMLRNYTKNV